jgi:20S proteasome subunit beta 6
MVVLPFQLVVIVSSLLFHAATSSSSFDPYLLDGGLVTAVAGRDYVLIASDTRLTDGGYGIRSRHHLSSRIWSAYSSSSLVADVNRVDGDGLGGTMMTQYYNDQSPVLVGSAGCSADCESLRRRMRLELDALLSSSSSRGGDGGMGVSSIANLLQQILYGRRTFPYYAFCVVAGLDRRRRGGEINEEGAVFVYDAIGSYERVAVCCAGSGRELLQPIIDRAFSPMSPRPDVIVAADGGGRVMKTTTTADVSASMQRSGVAGGLRSPVKTIVDCTWEDARDKVARAYASVAEREISVGDEVVICIVRKSRLADVRKERSVNENDDSSGDTVMEVFNYPLKRH